MQAVQPSSVFCVFTGFSLLTFVNFYIVVSKAHLSRMFHLLSGDNIMLMNFKTTLLAAASAVALTAGAATAATVTFVGGNTNENSANSGTVLSYGGNVSDSAFVGQNQLATPGRANIEFDWRGTSPNFLAYSQFTTTHDFSLTFQDYSPEEDLAGTNNQRSGFQLYLGAFGSTTTAIAGGDTCGSDVSSAFGSTDCVFVTGADNTGTLFTTPPTNYGLFAAGTYVLMFSEGNNPNNGSAEFLISSVPVPAAGLLLLGALGGFGALRRRKKA